MNLITVSAVASYIQDKEKLSGVTSMSIGIAFLIFIVILFYHIYKYIAKPQWQKWLICAQRCLSARRNSKPHRQIAVEDESTDSDSSDTQPNPRSMQPCT